MFYLLTVLIIAPLYLLMIITSPTSTPGADFSPISVVLSLLTLVVLAAMFIPSLAVQVRRFHDQDKSGWFVLLALIPFVGGLVLLVFNCLEGTRGPNRYGPDPKLDAAATFS